VSIGRFIRFALVGAVATGIQYLLLFIFAHWAGVDPVLSSSAGFIVSAFANYCLNHRYTFRSTKRHGPALIRFMTLAGVGLILNSAIMQASMMVGLHYLIAQMWASTGVLLWSFVGNSLWTFRGSCNRGDGPAMDKHAEIPRANRTRFP
jgi:putative flippase GtrA